MRSSIVLVLLAVFLLVQFAMANECVCQCACCGDHYERVANALRHNQAQATPQFVLQPLHVAAVKMIDNIWQ